jgi:tetratricopeptide (TPR) repeat protein
MHDLEERWYFPDMEAAGFRNQTVYERALLHSLRGQYHRALSDFRRAAALKPIDGPVVLASAAQLADLEAIQEAHNILDRAIERGVEPEADFFYQKGEVFRLAGQLDAAQSWFKKALESDPNHTGTLLKSGQLLLEQNKSLEEAVKLLTKAREKAPDHWEPIYLLGRAAFLRGETAKARSTLKTAIGLTDGSNAQILCTLGLNELRAGSTEEGSRLLLESMKLDRSSPETFGGLREGLRALGDPVGSAKAGEMQEKAATIRQLLLNSRSGPDPFEEKGPAFLEIARLHGALGSPSHQVRYLRLATAASPDMAEPYRTLAELARAQGEIFYRANSLHHVLRLNPRDSVAARRLALLYAQLGVRLKRGLELARMSLEMEESTEGRYALGELLFQSGDLEGAGREVALALQRSPDDQRIQELAGKLARTSQPEIDK